MKTGLLPIYFIKLSVLFLAILIASGCSKKNASTGASAISSVEAPAETTAEKTSEPENFYQWQIKKYPVKNPYSEYEDAEIYPFYEVYLYETVTNTQHFIFSRLDRSETFAESNQSPLWYYEPGGSTSYNAITENDKLKIISNFVSTGFSGDFSSEDSEDIIPESDSVVFEMDLNRIQLEEKPPVEQEFTHAPNNPEY